MKNHIVQTAPFPELLAVPTTQPGITMYDLTIDGEVNLLTYCTALLNKLFDLPQSEIINFINYQCTRVKDPVRWLNKLEKLLANNEELFSSVRQRSRFSKLYIAINDKRKELESTPVKDNKQKTAKKYINSESEDRLFSFYETKKEIESMVEEDKMILFLTNEIYEFQQASIEFINPKLPGYDAQCQKEIDRIQTVRKLKHDLEKSSKVEKAKAITAKKLKLNCNLNIFVDVLYQMQAELKEKGKPYLEATTQEIAEFVTNNFIDKDGQPISIASVHLLSRRSGTTTIKRFI